MAKEMTASELDQRAGKLLGDIDLATASYEEIVMVLTTGNYVTDLCIRALEERGLIENSPWGSRHSRLPPGRVLREPRTNASKLLAPLRPPSQQPEQLFSRGVR